LLRHPAALTYRIDQMPPVPAVLDFIRRHAHLDDREAYSTLNMGAGFALFVAAADADATVSIAQRSGVGARVAGHVHDGAKALVIEPLALRFDAADLQLR
jgi:phosphoribosylformylglycinamidine cyclo-ligase